MLSAGVGQYRFFSSVFVVGFWGAFMRGRLSAARFLRASRRVFWRASRRGLAVISLALVPVLMVTGMAVVQTAGGGPG
ncbi:hypothetical protein, partial [Frankia sp. Cr2]|uniref:hypothetical protein n=1 Tax=Frankia sp. Cr2 TaxID=3073932 RepID=UPI002AD42CFB